MRVPNMLPFFFTALKVGTTLAFIGAIVGEYFGGTSEVSAASSSRRMFNGSFDLAWAGIIIGAAGAIVSYFVVAQSKRVVIPWYASLLSTARPDDRLADGTDRPVRYRGRWRTPNQRARDIEAPVTGRDARLASGARTVRRIDEDEDQVDRQLGGCRSHRRGVHGGATRAPTGAATGTPAGGTQQPSGSPSGELTPVTLQLQWVPQAQFAGFFAAKDLGFYAEQGLDVDDPRDGPTTSRRRSSARMPNGPSSRSRGCPKVLEVRDKESPTS